MFAFSCRCQRQEIREITAGSPPPPVSNHLLSQTACAQRITSSRKERNRLIVTLAEASLQPRSCIRLFIATGWIINFETVAL